MLAVGSGSVLESVVSGPGEGVCATSVLYVSFCCSSVSYQCQEGGAESLFGPPQINCHIPKLSSSPWSVSFLLAGTVIEKAQAVPPPLQRGRGGPGPQQWWASAPAHFQAPPLLPCLHPVSKLNLKGVAPAQVTRCVCHILEPGDYLVCGHVRRGRVPPLPSPQVLSTCREGIPRGLDP